MSDTVKINELGVYKLLGTYDSLVLTGKYTKAECEELREEILRRMLNGTLAETKKLEGIREYKEFWG